jgi:ABC-type antimicrobial peptide transport system permease subunit
MTAVWARLRSDLRSGWRSWLILALLIGAFSGVVLAAAVGAHRTDTAYPRFIRATGVHDILVSPAMTGFPNYYANLAELDQVDVLATIGGAALAPLGHNGDPEFQTNVFMPTDGRYQRAIDEPRIRAGRIPRADAPLEIFANPPAADRYGLRVGSTIAMAGLHFPPGATNAAEPQITQLRLRVVGIGYSAADIIPTAKLDSSPGFVTSPAFFSRYVPDTVSLAYDGAVVRLKPGADVAAFRREALVLARSDESVGGEVFLGDQADSNVKVDRAIRPLATALGLFAAFAGLAGFFVLGQAMVRQLALDATEVPILRTLGLTRPQLVVMSVLRAAVVAATAALVAVPVAIALTPMAPIGAARRAEIHPGVEVNVAWLAAGAALIMVLFTARAVMPSLRLARVHAGVQGAAELAAGARPSALARAAGQAGFSPAAATGIRMALEPGHGRTAVPVRATLAGILIGLAALASAMTFAVSLNRLISSPELYGRTWDVAVDGQFASLARLDYEPVLRASKVVQSFSGGYYGEATVAKRAVTSIGLDSAAVGPSLVEGRAPRTDDEVVLGTTTLRRSGSRIGDKLSVQFANETRTMTVVGRAVFPALGRGGFPQTGLGEGVWATDTVVQPPPDPQAQGQAYVNFWLVRTKPGTTDAQRARLEAQLTKVCGLDCLTADEAISLQKPAEIAALERVRWTPVVLAGLLGLLAVATVGQTLVTSTRRRRRDLAVLKTLGFLRSQVSATVAWQATTLAALAAVIGLPAGLLFGRIAWRALGDQLGIVPDPATPAFELAIAVPVTIVLANLMALVPGLIAGRIRPAVALRTE